MRWLLVFLAAMTAGAMLGETVANVTVPSHARMREYAADLVPPGAAPTSVGEVSGPELLVGVSDR